MLHIQKTKLAWLLLTVSLLIGISDHKAQAETITSLGDNRKIIFTKTSLSKVQTKTEAAESKTETVEVVYTPNTYPVGQCTWGAKELAPWAGNNWGNAGEWAASAVAEGFTVGAEPKVGSIMVWSDGGYGHVAVVTGLASDGTIQVQESNYAGSMAIADYRGYFDPATESVSAVISYIYPKDTTA